MSSEERSGQLVRLLRAGLLLLAALSIAGLILELVFLRHWGGTQTIVWLGIGALSLALGLLVIRPSRGRVRAAQGLALVALLVSAVGLGLHVQENLHAGPLDRDYADRWERMSQLDQLVAASTGDVGPAPTLAPGSLAQIGALLLLGSIGHPALAGKDEATLPDERSHA